MTVWRDIGWVRICAIVAALLVAGSTVAHARGRRDDADVRRRCRGNLMRVGEFVYAAMEDLQPDDPVGEGWFAARLLDLDREQIERLVCRADPKAGKRDRERPIRGLFSYPVRNLETHPLDEDADEPQVIAVCPHHDDGAFVMTDDFDIRFVSRAELGAEPTGELVVGEGATHPALACVRFEEKPNEELVRAARTRDAKTRCADRLRQLGAVLTAETIERGRPRYSGPALFVSFRTKFYIMRGQEQVLLCPLDPHTHAPRSEAESRAYDDADLSKSVRHLTSFAVRDFAGHPIRRDATTAEPVAACIHHEEGALVLYNDGSVKLRDRDALGLGPLDELTVGARSKSPLLRPLLMDAPQR